jgi:integration host factor subunit beta
MVDILEIDVLGLLWDRPRAMFELRREQTMTKADLIDEVSKVSSLTKKETETIVNTIFDNITDALGKGDKVELRGFGSFRIRHRNSRKGRNPKTGSSVDVPQKRVPFFKVGKRLRELVNG